MAVGRIHFCVQCQKEHWLLSVDWKLSSGPCHRDISNVATCFIKTIKPRRQERDEDGKMNLAIVHNPTLRWYPITFAILIIPLLLPIFGKLLGSAQAQAGVGDCNKTWRQIGRGHGGLLRSKSTPKWLLSWFLKQKRWSLSTWEESRSWKR